MSYTYELRKSNKIVGYYTTKLTLCGNYFPIPVLNYIHKVETIEVPISYICIKDDGIEYTIRRYLDVSYKSKRQIDLIKDKK